MSLWRHPEHERPHSGPLFAVEMYESAVVIDGMQIGSIRQLAPGCRVSSLGPEATLAQAHRAGLVVLEGAPEPFGGPHVADALVRAAEFLKSKGWRPVGSEVAANA